MIRVSRNTTAGSIVGLGIASVCVIVGLSGPMGSQIDGIHGRERSPESRGSPHWESAGGVGASSDGSDLARNAMESVLERRVMPDLADLQRRRDEHEEAEARCVGLAMTPESARHRIVSAVEGDIERLRGLLRELAYADSVVKRDALLLMASIETRDEAAGIVSYFCRVAGVEVPEALLVRLDRSEVQGVRVNSAQARRWSEDGWSGIESLARAYVIESDVSVISSIEAVAKELLDRELSTHWDRWRSGGECRCDEFCESTTWVRGLVPPARRLSESSASERGVDVDIVRLSLREAARAR